MIEMFDKDFLASCKVKPKPQFKLGQTVYCHHYSTVESGVICGIDMSIWDKDQYYFQYVVGLEGRQVRLGEELIRASAEEWK